MKYFICLTVFASSCLFLFGKHAPFSEQIEVDLNQFEHSTYSQNGEDGVIQKIFEIIGTDSHYFVEFGGSDGYTGSNIRVLRDILGWNGLMLDGGHEKLEINLHKEFVTAENINELFEKYEVPTNLDLLSIDIDYNDFYVWKNLDFKFQPRLVVVEYNSTHSPTEDKVVAYNAFNSWDQTNYFGASILAFYNLAKTKGYSLVHADKKGVNLFFIRNDLIECSKYVFKNINDVESLYAPPKYGYGPNGGHPKDTLSRQYLRSVDLLSD